MVTPSTVSDRLRGKHFSTGGIASSKTMAAPIGRRSLPTRVRRGASNSACQGTAGAVFRRVGNRLPAEAAGTKKGPGASEDSAWAKESFGTCSEVQVAESGGVNYANRPPWPKLAISHPVT